MRSRTAILLSFLALSIGGLASAQAAPFPSGKKALPGGKKALKPKKPLVKPKGPKGKKLFPPMQESYPLEIKAGKKGPLVCRAAAYCTLSGSFGSTRYPIAIYDSKGVELTAVARSWSSTRVKFQVPAKTEPGYYFVQLMDMRRVKKSNFVQVIVQPKHPSCDNPDRDGDRYDAVHCGGTDCDDTNRDINPGVKEFCDPAGVDEDCDPTTFGTRDRDGDRHIDWDCCNGQNCGSDCNDKVASIHHGAGEVCNHIDDNCDGDVDRGVQMRLYRDADNDFYGDPKRMKLACCQDRETGWVANDSDCNDRDRNVKPGSGCP